MKLKKFFAVATACAVAAISSVVLVMSTVNAAETEIAYTGPTDGAFSMNDDGSTLRLNIFNEWSSVKALDINKSGTFEEAVNVTFTVSGLKGSCNTNEDGSDGDAYKAELVGAIGTNEYWDATKPEKNNVINDSVALNGDGQYTVSFKLTEASDTVLCLILSTNINAYNYASNGNPAETGITFKIDKITTGGIATGGDNTNPTEAPTNADGTPQTTTTTTTDGTGGSVTTTTTTTLVNNNSVTTANSSGGAVLGNSTQTDSASTGDAGVAVAVAGLVLTAAIGTATVALRSKK